jgi:glutaredoxin
VREFLSGHDVPFEDRNIRRSEAARAELTDRTGALLVPQLFWRDHHVVGFDPEALGRLADAFRAAAASA